MQMSGGKGAEEEEQPVQRSWGRGIVVNLKRHRASLAGVGEAKG